MPCTKADSIQWRWTLISARWADMIRITAMHLFTVQKQNTDVLASQAETQISEKFGVNAQTAREIYGLEDRTEYTVRIYNIVKALGLE